MFTRSLRRALPVLAALLATVLAPGALRAQNVIEQQASKVTELMRDNGLTKRAERDGQLHESEAIELVMDISAGSDIVIAGFCDQDCSDLDMRVTRNGTLLGEDILDDDAPMVRLQGYGGGVVRVRVEMPACSVAPCAFRVMVFGK